MINDELDIIHLSTYISSRHLSKMDDGFKCFGLTYRHEKSENHPHVDDI